MYNTKEDISGSQDSRQIHGCKTIITTIIVVPGWIWSLGCLSCLSDHRAILKSYLLQNGQRHTIVLGYEDLPCAKQTSHFCKNLRMPSKNTIFQGRR